MPSFTTQIPNLQQSGPICQVTITPSFETANLLRQQGLPIPSSIISALIDTGASVTGISSKVVQSLELVPRGRTNIATPSSGSHPANVYDIALKFGETVTIGLIRAVEVNLIAQNIDCLIGRDVLHHGVLIYIGYTNLFTLSF